MITIKDFMEVSNFRVTEGSDYCWSCFGPKAYRLDSWNGKQDGYNVSIVFDTETQEVYEAEAHDYKNKRSYRIQSPEYVDAYIAEAKSRNLEPDVAWDEDWDKPVKYIDLATDGDFLEKARAIVLGEEYDTRVQIEVDFSDEELLKYMKLAHDLDITFNELVERALLEKLNELKKEIKE